MNYKLVIQFEGSKYSGWQKQAKTDLTIQGKLEKILKKKFNKSIQVIGCSRTDSGVHAIKYVANFTLNESIDESDLKQFFNSYLPEDIVVKEVKLVNDRFHARYNTTSKTYLYKIDNLEFANVFTRKYAWHIASELDILKMKTASSLLVGTHDFKGFTNKAKNKNTIRTINSIDINSENGFISIKIDGSSFLLNMVRILVGTLKEIGEGTRDIESINNIFETGDRELSGERAPAKGLHLLDVNY